MDTNKSTEHSVRLKIGLIFLVIILFFVGLFIYSYSLKKNMDMHKLEMNNSYKVLSVSNQLIISLQQAQEILNNYLATPRRIYQQQFDSISSDISKQILNLESMEPEKEQNMLLKDIDSLMQEKNIIVRRLTVLFRSENPLNELDEKITRYDDIVQDSVVVTTNIDTIRVEKQRKGFWNRVKNVFNPAHSPDTTINIARTEQELKSVSRMDTAMYADLKNITEEASKTYTSQILGIEREVKELLFAEQNISLHISKLTNEFYNEVNQATWRGTRKSEELTRKIFRFAIIVGTLSIVIILIIIFLIIDDLNKGQKARSALIMQKKLTEELTESRHKLLLSVSHDIKTPLSSMMGYMEIWDSDEKDKTKKRQLQTVRNSGKHILNMLTNLLEFSRLEQNTVKLHCSRFNLIDFMEDIINMFQPFTDEKSLTLKFENRITSPFFVKTDHMILKQILTNIISNAVKYTTQGDIIIKIAYDNQLVFSVIDTGIGMDSDELPEIFKPFSRMQNPLKAEGSGFGMYVTKGLVELLHGNINVMSEKGKGTNVTIRIPMEQESENTDLSLSNSKSATHRNYISTPMNLPYQKILVFEDDHSLGKMIIEFLKQKGYKVKLCNNPEDINGFMRVISQFDIVFTDMQMKEISGIDILHEIRKRDIQIPVWLMTAYDEYDAQKAISYGFSGLIKKPIQMSYFTEILTTGNILFQNEYLMDGIIPEYHKVEKKDNIEEKNDILQDFPQLSTLFQGDEQTIKEILSSFIESSHKDMEMMSTYIENDEFEKAQQLSHKIHPFFSQLDADYLCSSLRKMDMLRGADESAYPNWKDELSKTIASIRQFTYNIEKKWL